MNGDSYAKNSKTENDPRGYKEIVLENTAFQEYYKAQNLMSNQDFEKFMDTLKVPLPVSFRITGSKKNAFELRDFMRTQVFDSIKSNDSEIALPKPIPWFPNELGYVFECSRTELRKNTALSEFHRFLDAENEVGNICRQEAVSMIPVLLLDVHPGQNILDMCAAPGSKTTQLLEGVSGLNTEVYPDGLVIANDSNKKRAQMLVHQAKRLNNPCLIVTNHKAEFFPKIVIQENGVNTALQFDRILADVPCSGDGTIRKNKLIWNSWKSSHGNNLHKIQFDILDRSCELLKVGGRLVYSTCTFNPIECEAVVSQMIEKAEGALKLVDVSKELLGLDRYPGISEWVVKDQSGNLLKEYNASGEGIRESMFPPKNIKEYGMEKCVRIYPHSQNSGGFFVAVLEKVAPYGSIDKFNQRQQVNYDQNAIQSSGIRKKTKLGEEADDEPLENSERNAWNGIGEAPFRFIPEDNEILQKCFETYGLNSRFPKDLLMVRSNDENDFNSIYAVSKKAKAVITAVNNEAVYIINSGVKLFLKNGGVSNLKCPFRVCSEGVDTISPFLSPERRVEIQLDDLVLLIKEEYPKFESFSNLTKKKFEGLEMGSCVLQFDPQSSNVNDKNMRGIICLPFYRANVSASLLLNKHERKSLLFRLTGEEWQRGRDVPKKQ